MYRIRNNSWLHYVKKEKGIVAKIQHIPQICRHEYKDLGFGCADSPFKRNFIRQGPPDVLQMSITQPTI